MSRFFLELLEISIMSSFLILAVIIVRGIFFKKAPKWTMCILWSLVGIKLLIPISIESEFAIAPNISLEKDKSIVHKDTSYDTSYDVSYDMSLDTSYDMSLDTSYDMSYDTSYDMSYDTSYDMSYDTSYDMSYDTSYDMSYDASYDASQNIVSEDFEHAVSTDNTTTEETSHGGIIGETTSTASNSDKNNTINSPPENAKDKPSYKTLSFSPTPVKICSILWFLFALSMILFGIAKYINLKKRVAVFSPHKDGTRKCETIDSPFVLGIFFPHIYLPFNLSDETEKYIIAHEKAHIKRFDHISKIIAYFALSVHWFNPLVWVAFILLCKDIEYACDEKVLSTLKDEEKKHYAAALLEFSIKSSKIPACPVAFGEIGVKERVKNILSYKKPLLWIIISLILISVALAVIFIPTSKNDNELSEEISVIQSSGSETQESSETSTNAESPNEITDSSGSTESLNESTDSSEIAESPNESTDSSEIAESPNESADSLGSIESPSVSTDISGSTEPPSENDSSADEDPSPAPAKKNIDLYVRNEDVTGFNVVKSTTDGNVDDIISQLISRKCIPEGTKAYSFVIKGKTANIDLSQAFGNALTKGTTEEEMTTGCLFNTIIKFYKVDNVSFTVEGKIFETGYVRYDFPIGFKEGYIPNVEIDSTIKASGTCGDNAKWKILSDSTLIIYGTGAMYDNYSPWADTNCYVKSLIISRGITSIGKEAFANYGCKTLSIADTVTSIGSGAFRGWNSLKSVVIPGSVKTIERNSFFCCKSLSSVTIQNGVEVIESNAFGSCLALKEISLPNSVKTIGISAFSNCTSLETFEGGSSLKVIDNSAFSDCTSLKTVKIDKIEIIRGHAFSNCSSLAQITIPNTLLYAEGGIFENTALYNDLSNWENGMLYLGKCLFGAKADEIGKNVIVKEGTKVIAGKVFYENKTIKTVSLPSSLTSIGSFAFYGCSSISEITLPTSTSRLGNGIFKNCTGLTSANLGNVTKIEEIGEGLFEECKNLKSVIFSSGATVISPKTFYNCSSLETVNLGTSVKHIEDEAFYQCSSLETLIHSKTIVSIGEKAFSNCSKIKSLDFGNSIVSVGSSAFVSCTSLEKIDLGNSIESISRQAFKSCTALSTISLGNNINYIGYDSFLNSGYYNDPKNWENDILYLNEYLICAKPDTIFTDVIIKDGTVLIANSAFYGFSIKGNVIFPETVKIIGSSAFNSSTLQSIVIPESVELMGQYVLSGSNIKTAVIKAPITVLPNGTFSLCHELTEVSLPSTITTIEDSAFYFCDKMEKINIPVGVKVIGNFAFKLCKSLKSISLPSHLVTLGESAFEGCKLIESIILPDSLETISKRTFYDCESLTSVKTGNNIRSIEKEAFMNCKKLTSIELPASITKLGEHSLGVYMGSASATIYVVTGYTITAPSGSVAEKYAKENNISFIAK